MTPEQIEKLSQLMKSQERTIPLLTDQESYELSQGAYELRSAFAAWCVEKQMYYTLSLLGCCEIEVVKDLQAIAAVTNIDSLKVMLHPMIVKLFKSQPKAAMLIMLHEIRHLIQLASFRDIEEMTDLSPIRNQYVRLRDEAVAQEHKDIWQKQIDAIEDKNNDFWRKRKYSISNIVMDACLHVDALKLLPMEHQVNSFLRETFSPYQKGNPIDPAEAVKIGLITTTGLNDLFNGRGPCASPEDIPLGEELDCNQEWFYFQSKYIEYLAKQIQKQDPNDPGSGDPLRDLMDALSTLDGHEFGDGDGDQTKRSEAERRVREALKRAMEQGALMAHHAGKNAADGAIFGNSLAALNNKVKKVLEALKVKISRILAPSNKNSYTYQAINKFYGYADLPGHQKIIEAKKSVVLIADTSGSMWDEAMFTQMCAAARLLHKQNKLAAFYCCDTELHRIDFTGHQGKVQGMGGGGTTLDSSHVTQILSDLKAKRVEIVYLTDMCVDLQEISQDKRCVFHAINIEKIIGRGE